MSYICYNGIIQKAAQPVFTADNRGYRYGDGFFETIRVHLGRIPLQEFHRARIEQSLQLLQYEAPTEPIHAIFDHILQLCRINHCETDARVRLSFSNGAGGIFQPNTPMEYLIEATPFQSPHTGLNTKGLHIGICPVAKKTADAYSNLKSANCLIYRVAADFAIRNLWDDALVLNQQDHIIETTIANIFWIREGTLFTPPLASGCISGVMRASVLSNAPSAALQIVEKECSPEELLLADEVFITNALRGIQWVKQFAHKEYQNLVTSEIYRKLIEPLF